MYKYPVPNPYATVLYGHRYYLLNCSEIATNGFINFYYNKRAKEVRESLGELLEKERKKRQAKLCLHEENYLSLFQEVVNEQQSHMIEKMSEIEFNMHWRKFMECDICLSRSMREDEICAVKIGVRFRHNRHDIEVKEQDRVTKVFEFFSNKGFSVLDILIRCSIENTILYTTQYISDVLHVKLMPYDLLWKIMENSGLLKK